MTCEEYGGAYEAGYTRTIRFLVSRGLSYDSAEETAQAAWVQGWQRLDQLRDDSMVVTWTNRIALNLHLICMRREGAVQELPSGLRAAQINMAAIDAALILKNCKASDRLVLQDFYIDGLPIREIARSHGWTETAVRIRLTRARRAVRRWLARLSRRTLRAAS